MFPFLFILFDPTTRSGLTTRSIRLAGNQLVYHHLCVPYRCVRVRFTRRSWNLFGFFECLHSRISFIYRWWWVMMPNFIFVKGKSNGGKEIENFFYKSVTKSSLLTAMNSAIDNESNIPSEKWFVKLRVSKVWLCQLERLTAFEAIFFLEILRCMRNQFRWLMWSQRLKSNHFIVE